MSLTEAVGPSADGGAWGTRYDGLTLQTTGRNTVKEFTGMWPLKPDADLEALQRGLLPGGWTPPDSNFCEATTALGLIRTARWFVLKTEEYGWTLVFVTQFDGSMEKYFDDFVLNGKENLQKVWGQCIGCPMGPESTAAEVVEYIARGQIKTLAVYDFVPSLSNSQIFKHADWYEKAQRFQRAVAKGEGNLEDMVAAYLEALAEPSPTVPSADAIDTEVATQWQYDDHPEYLGVPRA
jgi:hypothetical protein